MQDSELLWTPDVEQVAYANVTRFMQWLARERGLHFADYTALWQWSVTDLDAFWQALWDYFQIDCSAKPSAVLGKRTMPGAEWFPGARLNYAEHVLRAERLGGTAVLSVSELSALTAVSWEEIGGKVRILATHLRELGVKPGDRVVAWMPNIPETMIAMLATTAIGAIWACCSPDFGARGVLDRVKQLTPSVLISVDGYRYGGKDFDRRAELRTILEGLDSVRHAIHLPYLHRDDTVGPTADALLWHDVMAREAIPREAFAFEQVAFDHPLWTLFSSGTTGLPKPIVHGHGGILLETLKNGSFAFDLHPGERIMFFTTTGWMLWNFVVGSTLTGAVPVLYDGHPAYPSPDTLWKLADEADVAIFGASPTFVAQQMKAGIVPRDRYALKSLRGVTLAGSPATPECMAWFYDHVKRNLWVANGSGGTDCCTGFVGGVPTLPVRAGEIQGPSLGVAIAAFNERGESVIDEVGELVMTEPMPSMPLFFWGDTDNQRYLETYFDTYPGVWRHGDFFRINARGGSFVLGRSDSTLNRFGVRIGTAEIYRTLALINDVEDALIVNLDLADGGFFMPLFVKLLPGKTLTPELEKHIRDTLRREYTPRHVPDKIIQVPLIPYTLTGKKMEVPIRKILLGVPVDKAANRSAMMDASALDFFIRYHGTQQDTVAGKT